MAFVDLTVFESAAVEARICEQARAERAVAHTLEPAGERACRIWRQDRVGEHHRLAGAVENDVARVNQLPRTQANFVRFVDTQWRQLLK